VCHIYVYIDKLSLIKNVRYKSLSLFVYSTPPLPMALILPRRINYCILSNVNHVAFFFLISSSENKEMCVYYLSRNLTHILFTYLQAFLHHIFPYQRSFM